MVKAIGIIAEYNPFHNGHLWHLCKCREVASSSGQIGYTVAVMSGNFVQRGETAIFDKWSRAAMAVEAGVDLVIELPFVFSVRSAQYFAAGAVRLLSKLGIISHICFGSEKADLELLNLAAIQINSSDTIIKLRQNLKTGKTYAAALAEALGENSLLSADFLSAPNNILGIEYLRAINAYAPQIIPIPIQRYGAKHHDQKFSGPIASASAIRRELLTNVPDKPEVSKKTAQVIPPSGADQITGLLSEGAGPSNFKSLDNIILANFRLKTLEQIAALPEVTEGLEYKIAQASLKAASSEELLTLLKSKRYPKTRLQRILVHSLIGSTKGVISLFDQTGPLYARVLAFNEKGRVLLKEIKPNFPVISKTAGYLNKKELRETTLPPLKAMLALDVKSSDIYSLSLPNNKFKTGGMDFLNSPIFLR